MNRLAAAIAFGVVVILLSAAAQAQTADDLKAELAAKNAYISKLERRIRQLESQPARSSQPPPTPMGIAPVGGRPPAVPSAAAGVAVAPPPAVVHLPSRRQRRPTTRKWSVR